MPENEHRFYDFGEFRLDTEERQLLKKGEPVSITFRAYEVLHALVINGGRIMEKDDLMQIVWGDTIVEEGNLKNLVYGLRKALGDETGNSQFIQTLPKRGYRFVAEVTSVPTEGLIIERHRETEITIEEEIETDIPAELTAAKPVIALPAAKGRSVKSWMFAVPLVLVLLVAGAYFFNFIPTSRKVFALENAKVTPLTFGTNALAPVISPDGKFVAYIFSDAKGKAVMVRQLATNSTLKLMDLNGSMWAIGFSHDSNFVYIVNGNDEHPKGVLYQVPAIGGSQPRKLVEGVGSMAVSRQDGQIAFLRDGAKFLTISGDGKNERELFDTKEKLKGTFQSFVWAADGKSFIAAILRVENNVPYWQVAEFGLDGSGEREIGPRFAKPVNVQTTPDGNGVIVLDLDADAFTSKLLYLPRYGSEPARALTRDINYYTGISLTSDGRTMLAARMARPTELSIAPANDLENSTRVASGYLDRVVWLADGKLMSDAIENGQTDIWTFDPASGVRQQLTNNSKRNNNPSVSPDGRFVFYTSNFSGRSQLWRMNIDGSETKQLTDLPFSVQLPMAAPDGNSVYFAGQPEGRTSVFRMGRDGGEPEKVLDSITGLFAVSADGKRIAFTNFEGDPRREKLFVHDLSGAEKDRSFDLPHSIFWAMKWSRDGQALEYIGNEGLNGCIYSQPLTGGAPSAVRCLQNNLFVNFAWSPDGKQLAFTSCHYLLDAVIFSLN